MYVSSCLWKGELTDRPAPGRRAEARRVDEVARGRFGQPVCLHAFGLPGHVRHRGQVVQALLLHL